MKPILQLIAVFLCLAYSAVGYSQKAGTIDSSFGTNGSVYVGNPNYSLKVEKAAFDLNGKLLVLYSEDEYSATNYSYITRFNTDGSVDATFGYGGTGTYNMRDEEMLARHFDIAPNGRIAILGERNFSGDRDLELCVLTSNGQLDPNFSGDGKILFTNSSITSETPNGVVILPDGKIVVAESYFSTTSANKYGVMFQRVDSVGMFDFSFGTLGYFVSEIPGVTPFFKNIYYNGSRLVGVGGYDSIAHLDGFETLIGVFTDAGADAAYGTGGYWQQHEADANNSGRSFEAAIRLANGEILSSFSTAIYTPTLTYTDARVYHNNGINYNNINQSDMITKGLYEQPDGKVVLCGVNLNSTPKIQVRRLTSGFGFDNAFATSSNFSDTTDYRSEANCTLFSDDEKLFVFASATTNLGDKTRIKILRLYGNDAPQINISSPVTTFTSTVGVASSPQTATVSISAITGGVSVTAPAGFELSINGTSYSQQITISSNQFIGGNANFYLRFHPLQAGNFSGNVTASAGNYSSSVAVSGSTATGIQDLLTVVFSIYPNPTRDFLEINFNKTNSVGTEISIINPLGEEVLRATTVEESTKLNVSSLARGIYFLRSGNSTKRFEKY